MDGPDNPTKRPSDVSEVLEIDGRLYRLERATSLHRSSLVTLQDAVLGQMATVAILEVVLAVVLAAWIFEHYHESTREA